MSAGAHRRFRYRIPRTGEGQHVPEAGDFMVSVTSKPEEQWATYRVLAAVLYRDEVEPWCNGGHPDDPDGLPEGFTCRVLHFRVSCVRVPTQERPQDAMTWRMLSDKPHHRH